MAEDIVVVNVGVVSMLEPGVQEGQNVTVRGGKIVAIGPEDAADGARVIANTQRIEGVVVREGGSTEARSTRD